MYSVKKITKNFIPTGSQPGLFYGTDKVHKLQGNQGLNELTVRPIISNIGTATYETAKYLNNLLSPLGKSQHTVPNSKKFVEKIKEERIPIGYKMISFDAKSLFTNVPLDETIETILQKLYVEKKIKTSIPKPILKELLLLYTKHLLFRFNGETYTQIDGVAMESPLGPLLANIFMISLEEKVLPIVSNYLCYWKRYVDDTYAYVVPEKIGFILKESNFYHPNIKFTYELEENNKITFLDVLINRISFNEIETSVYRKESNTDI